MSSGADTDADTDADTEALRPDVAAALGCSGAPGLLGEVVVLVGTSGSGKTTLRRELVSRGLPPDQVVRLDDLRRRARGRDVAASRPPRGLQEYSAVAVRSFWQRCPSTS